MPKKCSKTLKQNTQKVMETICQNAEKNIWKKCSRKCWKDVP